ncbi:MAG: hypothetical protein ACXABY_01415 [Candidatus Thorarchaeota archaeon]|jgi:hypothetical protein
MSPIYSTRYGISHNTDSPVIDYIVSKVLGGLLIDFRETVERETFRQAVLGMSKAVFAGIMWADWVTISFDDDEPFPGKQTVHIAYKITNNLERHFPNKDNASYYRDRIIMEGIAGKAGTVVYVFGEDRFRKG